MLHDRQLHLSVGVEADAILGGSTEAMAVHIVVGLKDPKVDLEHWTFAISECRTFTSHLNFVLSLRVIVAIACFLPSRTLLVSSRRKAFLTASFTSPARAGDEQATLPEWSACGRGPMGPRSRSDRVRCGRWPPGGSNVERWDQNIDGVQCSVTYVTALRLDDQQRRAASAAARSVPTQRACSSVAAAAVAVRRMPDISCAAAARNEPTGTAPDAMQPLMRSHPVPIPARPGQREPVPVITSLPGSPNTSESLLRFQQEFPPMPNDTLFATPATVDTERISVQRMVRPCERVRRYA